MNSYRALDMKIDHKIVFWLHRHMDELTWYEGAQGGTVTRRNGITILMSMNGLVIGDGLRSCTISIKEVKKLMDTEDYTAKDVHDAFKEIRKKAVDQIINRMDNPDEKDRIKRELFNQLSDGF